MSGFRIVTLHDYHSVGSDGRPEYHLVNMEVIPTERLRTYRYRFDASVADVEVSITEGSDVAEGPGVDEDGLSFVDVILEPPAEVGERRLIGFETEFAYREQPPGEFRRFTGSDGFETWEVRLVFSINRPPTSIAWAEWDGYGEGATIVEGSIELLTLRSHEPDGPASREYAVECTRENVPAGKVLGVFWEW